jgi:flagellar protein FliT
MSTPNPPAPDSEPLLSLEDGHALLNLYEAMLEAARAHDWDRLSDMERQTTVICESSLHPATQRTAEERVELGNVLTRIQHLDHEIRTHLEPARDEARQQLAMEVKSHAVRTAYGIADSNDPRSPGG